MRGWVLYGGDDFCRYVRENKAVWAHRSHISHSGCRKKDICGSLFTRFLKTFTPPSASVGKTSPLASLQLYDEVRRYHCVLSLHHMIAAFPRRGLHSWYDLYLNVFVLHSTKKGIRQPVSQPEHVSSVEDHVKLGALQHRRSLRHLRCLSQAGLLQQKLTWRPVNTEGKRTEMSVCIESYAGGLASVTEILVRRAAGQLAKTQHVQGKISHHLLD